MSFSHRLPWRTKPNAIASRLAARKPAYDLTESNPTKAGFHYPPRLCQALADPRALVYEPDPRGLEATREFLQADLLTASSSESYSYILKLLCDPGDEILAPRPSYPLFDYLANLEGVRVRQYPLFYDQGWHLDAAMLRAAVTPATKAIIVVNPNNPTGSFLKRNELAAIEELGLPIVSDEVFAPYGFGLDPGRVTQVAAESKVLSFSLGGLSKEAGLPQMKLGWIRVGGRGSAETLRKEALSRLEMIADTYLSVGAPVQYAARTLLEDGGIREQIRERIARNLAQAPEALQVEGGWYAILRLPPIRTEEEWILTLLDEYGTYVQPGYFFDFDSGAYAVVSLLTPPEIFEEGLGRLRLAQRRLLY